MYETMLACHNFFERTSEFGEYSVSAPGVVSATRGTYQVGQYVRIMDSLFNDGVYKISAVDSGTVTLTGTFTAETFRGYIVGLAVPAEFVTLSAKVEAFDKAGIASESIPNYSVSFNATDGATAYAKRLASYKKPYRDRYYFLNFDVTGVVIVP